ncbi:hypothetical protein T12_953 [Trichinella patagoniensis]|uniref:Uncharacterized protein n=1 Tax=Trichinella patagoniensis TaxID=990121 RepID=A0A0V0Z5D2_9BILA|nr:hypothetical protein T12_953 [Trichinella patagoniensis]
MAMSTMFHGAYGRQSKYEGKCMRLIRKATFCLQEQFSSFPIQRRYRTLLPILMYKEIALVLVWYGIMSLCFSLGYWVSRRRKSSLNEKDLVNLHK